MDFTKGIKDFTWGTRILVFCSCSQKMLVYEKYCFFFFINIILMHNFDNSVILI